MLHGREIKKMAHEIMDILEMPRNLTPHPFMNYFIFSIKDKYFVPTDLWETERNKTTIGFYSTFHDYIAINDNVMKFWDPDVAYALLFHEMAHRKECQVLLGRSITGESGGNEAYNNWVSDEPDGDICHGGFLKELESNCRVPGSVIDDWYKIHAEYFQWNPDPWTNDNYDLIINIEMFAENLINKQQLPVWEAWSRAITAWVPKRFCGRCHFCVQTVIHKNGEPLVMPPPRECPDCFRPIKQVVCAFNPKFAKKLGSI